MTLSLSVRNTLLAAQQVVRSLPSMQFVPKPKSAPPVGYRTLIEQPKAKRTYYLGFNGRVSQRKQLVGEVHATVRASTTIGAMLKLLDAAQRGELNLLPGCFVHVGGK